MTGDSEHLLSYENGRINKAWTNGTAERSQMEYKAYGTMSREYRECTGYENYDNENVYQNGKLKTIVSHESGNSYRRVEYTYQGDLVVEKREYQNNYVSRYYRYVYNDKNEMTSIIWDESSSGGSSYTLQVTFDDKVNPYFKMWKETNLSFWDSEIGLARYNLEFYPHNVLNLQ